MKYVSIRIPEEGPLGETLFEARVRAMVSALLVNRPSGGWVESVFTLATHFVLGLFGRVCALFLEGINVFSFRTILDA
jgi:hypothetical protein